MSDRLPESVVGDKPKLRKELHWVYPLSTSENRGAWRCDLTFVPPGSASRIPSAVDGPIPWVRVCAGRRHTCGPGRDGKQSLISVRIRLRWRRGHRKMAASRGRGSPGTHDRNSNSLKKNDRIETNVRGTLVCVVSRSFSTGQPSHPRPGAAPGVCGCGGHCRGSGRHRVLHCHARRGALRAGGSGPAITRSPIRAVSLLSRGWSPSRIRFIRGSCC